MLPGISGVTGFVALAGSTAATGTIIARDNAKSTSNTTSYTFSNMNIGTASSTRWVILAVFCKRTSGTFSSTPTVTVGGLGTGHVRSRTQGSHFLQIKRVKISSGTTADVVITTPETAAECAVSIIAVSELISTTSDYDFENVYEPSSGAFNITATLDFPDNGIVFGALYILNSGSQGVDSWDELTERVDDTVGSIAFSTGDADGVTEQTGVSVLVDGTNNGARMLIVCSFE